MHGSLWTGKRAKAIERVSDPGLLVQIAPSLGVGVIAGVFIANFKLNLGIPGHKAIIWMAPLIATGLRGRFRGSVSVGATAAMGVTFAMGANLAGGTLGAPLVMAAAGMLDVVIYHVRRLRLSSLLQIPIMGAAGMTGNLICFMKRILVPLGTGHSALHSFWPRLGSYLVCGLIAGMVGAGVVGLLRKLMSRGEAPQLDNG